MYDKIVKGAPIEFGFTDFEPDYIGEKKTYSAAGIEGKIFELKPIKTGRHNPLEDWLKVYNPKTNEIASLKDIYNSFKAYHFYEKHGNNQQKMYASLIAKNLRSVNSNIITSTVLKYDSDIPNLTTKVKIFHNYGSKKPTIYKPSLNKAIITDDDLKNATVDDAHNFIKALFGTNDSSEKIHEILHYMFLRGLFRFDWRTGTPDDNIKIISLLYLQTHGIINEHRFNSGFKYAFIKMKEVRIE